MASSTTSTSPFNLPNALSALRIVIALPAALALARGDRATAIVFCVVAAVSDILDGYAARRLNLVTEVGKFIDPLADKLFIGAMTAVMLIDGPMPPWFAIVVIGRDIAIFLGGMYVRASRGIVLMSNTAGKATVFVLSSFLLFVVATGRWADTPLLVLWMCTALALLATSTAMYAIRMVRMLSPRQE